MNSQYKEIIKNELLNDPENLGYSALIESDSWEDIYFLLNNKNYTLQERFMARSTFQLAIVTTIASISQIPDPVIKDMWKDILSVIQSSTEIDLQNSGVVSLLNLAVMQGLLTSEVKNSLGKVTCSRLELLGVKLPYTVDEIKNALL